MYCALLQVRRSEAVMLSRITLVSCCRFPAQGLGLRRAMHW